MTDRTSIETIADYLPQHIRVPLLTLPAAELPYVSEIRIYSGRAAAIVFPDHISFLTSHGLTANSRNLAAVKVSSEEMSSIVDRLSHFSAHSCTRELHRGCFVLKGGVRVGISGTYNHDGLITMVTGLNFRVARSVTGCSAELLPLTESGGVLICGPVNSGKTTILRDLCRQVGDRKKVALIDERGEIANASAGEPLNDVGALTDVLTGCSRSDGIVTAVRTLSPDFIFCDEIATRSDSRSILNAVGCGVRFCASIHGESYEDMMRRPIARELMEKSVFSSVVILAGANSPGKIAEVRRCGSC